MTSIEILVDIDGGELLDCIDDALLVSVLCGRAVGIGKIGNEVSK